MEHTTMHKASGLRVRADSWAAKLTPDQQWKLYGMAKKSGDWTEAMEWARKELHLDVAPSRSAFFNWMTAMRKAESDERLQEAAITIAEATALGKKMPKEEAIVATFMACALQAASAGNAKDAATYTRIADATQNMLYRRLEFLQKEDDRKKKEEASRNARESLCRNTLLTLAEKTGKPYEEIIKDHRFTRAYLKPFIDEMSAPLDDEAVNKILTESAKGGRGMSA